MRVYELAKDLDISSAELLAFLRQSGQFGSASTRVYPHLADRARAQYKPEPEDPKVIVYRKQVQEAVMEIVGRYGRNWCDSTDDVNLILKPVGLTLNVPYTEAVVTIDVTFEDLPCDEDGDYNFLRDAIAAWLEVPFTWEGQNFNPQKGSVTIVNVEGN